MILLNKTSTLISKKICKIGKKLFKCGDTTYQLPLLHSVLRFTSQQRSLAASISVSLEKRPFGAPACETTSEGHAYQLRHLINGEANQTVELGIKEARYPAARVPEPSIPSGPTASFTS
jgi:hypothetical protein